MTTIERKRSTSPPATRTENNDDSKSIPISPSPPALTSRDIQIQTPPPTSFTPSENEDLSSVDESLVSSCNDESIDLQDDEENHNSYFSPLVTTGDSDKNTSGEYQSELRSRKSSSFLESSTLLDYNLNDDDSNSTNKHLSNTYTTTDSSSFLRYDNTIVKMITSNIAKLTNTNPNPANTPTSENNSNNTDTTITTNDNNIDNNIHSSNSRRICNKLCGDIGDDESEGSSLQAGKRIWMGTLVVMNFLAKVLLWGSAFATIGAVVWYSIELKNNGTDPHLIAWFSSGAFVLLGFPISIYGIFMHLSNYYQPSIQCYVVRILWMVPVYSIESWLCLRFRQHAIYIETARDCYESFVLYSFLQYLEQVLGGERELVMMLKNKSPTRGVHIPPMNWCIRPWLMGQPVTVNTVDLPSTTPNTSKRKRRKQVQWTSPFYIKCKLGVLQYVILKLFTAIITMILEFKDIYKEGDFSYKGGYLYISIIINTSQCWALYCLVFFYNATKTELAPIRPVGKFLSVKCIVFFTWWQSLFIGILIEMNLIPPYLDWSTEEVAKGLQAYLICIEMFAAAIVHTFVFPHTDYVGGRKGVVMGADMHHHHHQRHYRLGRRNIQRRLKERFPASGIYTDIEMAPVPSADWDEEVSVAALSEHDDTQSIMTEEGAVEHVPSFGETGSVAPSPARPSSASSVTSEQQHKTNFVRAFIDSAVPRDVVDNTVGIVKGEFSVEKKTLLSHAAASDDYDLFSTNNKRRQRLSSATVQHNVSRKGGHSSRNKAHQRYVSASSTAAKIRPAGHRIKSKMNMNEFL